MYTSMKWVVALLLFVASIPANAYYAAVSNLNVSLSSSGYVQCAVMDPQTGSTMYYTGPTNSSVSQLTVVGGVVAYTSGTGFSRNLHAFTYDPYVKSFRAFSLGIYDQTVYSLTVRDGIVACWRSSGTFDGDFSVLTYDPSYGSGSWRYFSYGMTTNAVTHFSCSDGVAAIAFDSGFQTSYVRFVMYDAAIQDWRTDYRSVATITALSIQQATVMYTNASGSYYIGYDPSGSWRASYYSEPLCSFYAAAASGFDQKWIWVTDMSFGATGWLISYGDGSSFVQRSGFHAYNSVAQFGITSYLTGFTGSTTNCTDSILTGNVGIDDPLFEDVSIAVSDGFIRVKGWPAGQKADWRITDVRGAKLFSGTTAGQEDFVIRCTGEATGILILQALTNDGRQFTRRLLVNQ